MHTTQTRKGMGCVLKGNQPQASHESPQGHKCSGEGLGGFHLPTCQREEDGWSDPCGF